jgi:hypothetical protein
MIADWAPTNIQLWAVNNAMRCPNCETEFNSLKPMASLYPHWTGECRKKIVPMKERKP